MPTADVCHKHGLSQGTFYKFKSKYGGMEVSDAAKLKRLPADQILDNVVLKYFLGKTDNTEHATGCGTQSDAGS